MNPQHHTVEKQGEEQEVPMLKKSDEVGRSNGVQSQERSIHENQTKKENQQCMNVVVN